MRRIEPFILLSHGNPQVGDRRVLSGIIFAVRNGCPPSAPMRQIEGSV
jgi:transposase